MGRFCCPALPERLLAAYAARRRSPTRGVLSFAVAILAVTVAYSGSRPTSLRPVDPISPPSTTPDRAHPRCPTPDHWAILRTTGVIRGRWWRRRGTAPRVLSHQYAGRITTISAGNQASSLEGNQAWRPTATLMPCFAAEGNQVIPRRCDSHRLGRRTAPATGLRSPTVQQCCTTQRRQPGVGRTSR